MLGERQALDRCAKLVAELAAVQAALNARHEQLRMLGSELATTKHSLHGALSTIRMDNAIVDTLRAELAAKDARIAEQTSWAIGSAAANEEMRREIRTKDARIAELEKDPAANTSYFDTIDLIRKSAALRKELADTISQRRRAEAKAALEKAQWGADG